MAWEWKLNSKEIVIDYFNRMIEQYEKDSGKTIENKAEIMDFLIWFASTKLTEQD